MRHRWIKSLLMSAIPCVMAASTGAAAAPESPETMAARRLDREAQFELRLGRSDVAREKMEIAEWLSPNANRQSMILRITSFRKGKSNGQN